jgi:hypothetical protein
MTSCGPISIADLGGSNSWRHTEERSSDRSLNV